MKADLSDPQVVLVVDDEALLRADATEALQTAGCLTHEACDVEEALAMLRQNPEITVIFTDINMPGPRNGMDLAAEVARQRPDVRLIITSGLARPAAADIPDDGQFISKPYDPEVVAGIVAAFPSPKRCC